MLIRFSMILIFCFATTKLENGEPEKLKRV